MATSSRSRSQLLASRATFAMLPLRLMPTDTHQRHRGGERGGFKGFRPLTWKSTTSLCCLCWRLWDANCKLQEAPIWGAFMSLTPEAESLVWSHGWWKAPGCVQEIRGNVLTSCGSSDHQIKQPAIWVYLQLHFILFLFPQELLQEKCCIFSSRTFCDYRGNLVLGAVLKRLECCGRTSWAVFQGQP